MLMIDACKTLWLIISYHLYARRGLPMAIQSAPIVSPQTAALQSFIPPKPSYQHAKRLLDIVFSLCVLLPLGAVIGILAVMIRLDSKGPVLFRENCLGQAGVEFDMLK